MMISMVIFMVTQLPLIDLAPARYGGNDGKKVVAKQMHQACLDVGFFTICGHGIGRAVFDDLYRNMAAFFALPDEIKRTCVTKEQPCVHQSVGYTGLLENNAFAFMGRRGPSDYVEKFAVGRWILDDRKPIPLPESEEGVRYRASLKKYFQRCQALSNLLTELFAVAVDLPRDFFQNKTNDSWDFLRCHTFPGLSNEFDNEQGFAPHTDGSLLTILSDTHSGLEVQTRDGHWIAGETRDVGHLIVNIGEPMARWSNDVWRSTPHRVRLKAQPRQSVAFFKTVNDDTIINPFPKFCMNTPARYEPIVFSDWVKQKAQAVVRSKK